ncbi:hypothetical protein MBAV_003657, partial [Candidatus Magnetobacterium bavaricum]
KMIGNLMREAQKLQEKMTRLQEDARQTTASANSRSPPIGRPYAMRVTVTSLA